MLLEPTCLALCCRGAGCLSQNPPAGQCVAGVQAVKAGSEPTSQPLCCRGAVFLSGVGTYLPDTVRAGVQAN